ncbi:serine/threonine-protein kinase [Streptomyces sp. ISL-11]|uniref:serine/threonine-protein kinase n=1 Tax=Streptomyces sp. ISL-11 TaxID=2819174 RepID=UPI001BEC7B3D|nr:serine/threonine-protein kinase [Streptomyces sp. ISL-11]MBT2387224.1 serine/threonine protein kinase [Streptomyces sp. ISL-11]
MRPLLSEDPQVIGAYRLLGRLGAGGMGRVYLGRSAGGRTVAVKVVHPHFALDEQFRARFRREVEAARRVGGAWTAPVLDADPDAAVPWVATGYVAGPSLTEAVVDTGVQPEPTVRVLGAGLAEALEAVHGLGLVHRDVKPSNVLLALDGPRLIDFGIARATDATASLTATGVSIGSPGYMSPEQILGQDVTGAADVFSLGAVLAYAATGEPPFPGDSSAALLYRVVHEPPVLGPGLTGELRSLVEDCLAKAPRDRPAPSEVARRLAPAEGARGLVRAGWLPAPLLEQVSRRAVELLDLEAEAPTPGAVPVAAEGAGAFGPPDPSYGNGMNGVHQVADAAPPPVPPLTGPGEVPPGPGPASGPVERQVALSAAAGAGRDRRRRVSCTLVLSVAAALAVATTLAFVFDLLPGRGGDTDRPAGARPGSASPRETGSADAVPKDFLGTWTGDIRQSDGAPNGTMTAAITGGAKGAYVARTTYSVLNLLECRSKAKLVHATATRITLEEVSEGSPGPGCTGDTARITFTLADGGRLTYTSDDARGGKPTAALTRKSG